MNVPENKQRTEDIELAKQAQQQKDVVHLHAIIANSKDPHAVKAAQKQLEQLTAKTEPK